MSADDDIRALERDAEWDQASAHKYINWLKRTQHQNLPTIIAKIVRSEPIARTIQAPTTLGGRPQEVWDTRYVWVKELGSGPCHGFAEELNGSQHVPMGVVVQLSEAAGQFFFFYPLGQYHE